MRIVIPFASGCCFALLRPDAIPFGFLRRFSTLFLMVLKPLGVLFWASWGSLGGILEPLGAILGRLGTKLSGLGATFGAFRFLMFFWSDFGSKKGAQREAFGEPKRSKNRSKNELQM